MRCLTPPRWSTFTGGPSYFSFNDANYRAASRSLTPSPTWVEAGPVPVGPFNEGGWPEAWFWRRCFSGQKAEIKGLAEIFDLCDNHQVATDYAVTPGCPASTFTPVVFCDHSVLAVLVASHRSVSGEVVTAIDTADLGVVTKVGGQSAIITTGAGATVAVRWEGDAALESWDTGLRQPALSAGFLVLGLGTASLDAAPWGPVVPGRSELVLVSGAESIFGLDLAAPESSICGPFDGPPEPAPGPYEIDCRIVVSSEGGRLGLDLLEVPSGGEGVEVRAVPR